MSLPVALYIPNLLGYARILLAFVGLHLSLSDPWTAIYCWIASAFLDLFDGIAARALKQTSSFGVLLDIIADNILRSCAWIAAAAADPSYALPATAVVAIEWGTLVATQLHAAAHGAHWKTAREKDPAVIQAFFSNNFRNPIGTIGILGLFSANIFAYASTQPTVYEIVPYFDEFKYAAFLGRLVAVGVELWLCSGYLSLILRNDAKAKDERNKND